MNTKYVILLFYDIPNTNKEEQKKYLKFNKYIKSIGFIMMQESVYIMNINTKERYMTIKRDLKITAPINSNIRSLLITNNVFEKVEVISGEKTFRENIISKKIRVLEI